MYQIDRPEVLQIHGSLFLWQQRDQSLVNSNPLISPRHKESKALVKSSIIMLQQDV